jgi:hypothetical protein
MSHPLLNVLDWVLTFLHLFVVGFNLFGWIRWPKVHLLFILSTGFCWFGLGVWYGWGYCALTDWQWQIKAQLGQTPLPSSFIALALNRLGIYASDPTVSWITVSVYVLLFGVSVWANFPTIRTLIFHKK